jgi:2-isopropylmalate synthase
MALTTRDAYFGLTHGIDTTKIFRTSQRVAGLTRVPISVCKAIVGANAFAHESGIHQHGVLANPMTYEIMTPQSVGKTESTIVLGQLSGKHAFSDSLSTLGYTLAKEEIDEAFTRFKELADRKKDITDLDLEAIVNNMEDIPAHYKLESFQIQSGNKMHAMALITLTHEGNTVTEAATGDGPIDAAYNAATRIIGGEWTLSAYDIKAVTGGMDALGEVTVRVEHDGQIHVGSGLSTDIIAASILAYINAVNRATFKNMKNSA